MDRNCTGLMIASIAILAPGAALAQTVRSLP